MAGKNLSLGDPTTTSMKISLQSKSKSSSPRSIFTKSQLKSHNHDLLGETCDKSNQIKLLNYKINDHITYI